MVERRNGIMECWINGMVPAFISNLKPIRRSKTCPRPFGSRDPLGLVENLWTKRSTETMRSDKALQIVSNKPVSALSYTDQDYYVPAATGLFSGNLFYGFSGYSGDWENSITITSYASNNVVLVTQGHI